MADLVPDEEVPPPKPERVQWAVFVEEIIEAAGAWKVEAAASPAAASTAVIRLRGRGQAPLVDEGLLEVRRDGNLVYARLSPDRPIAVDSDGNEFMTSSEGDMIEYDPPE